MRIWSAALRRSSYVGHAQEKKKKIYIYINAQNKINLIKRLFKKFTLCHRYFPYHVTHDVRVYAVCMSNGYCSLPVLICWHAIKGRPAYLYVYLMYLAIKIFPYFSFWYHFNIASNKDLKKLSSKLNSERILLENRFKHKNIIFSHICLKCPPPPPPIHFACDFS